MLIFNEIYSLILWMKATTHLLILIVFNIFQYFFLINDYFYLLYMYIYIMYNTQSIVFEYIYVYY